MSIKRVLLNVTQTFKPSEAGVETDQVTSKEINLPIPASGISHDWIVQSISNQFSQFNVQIVELKYEDDEHDLITFSSEHEVLEAIAIADAAQQETFKVFATISVETKISPTNSEEKQDNASPAGIRAIFAQIAAYLSTLSDSARESIADAVQVGIQQLKELGDPKQALLDTLALFPESPSFDLLKIVNEVKRVSNEQWEQVKAFVKKIPEQTWAFIEQSVPQLVNFLKMFGSNASAAAESAFNPLAAMMSGAFAGPRADTGAQHPAASFAQFAPLLGMMSMMGGGRTMGTEQKEDVQGVSVQIESVDEMIPVAEPGMHVIRTWKVKNTGSSQLPEGVQLRAVADPHNLASSEISPIVTLPRLNPGEVTEVSQLLQAPAAEGAYNVVYALKTLYGQGPSIGPDIPVEVLVTEAY